MKVPRCPHRWSVTPAQAVRIQRELASRIVTAPLENDPILIAGADMAIAPDGKRCVAGVVVWDRRTGCTVEQQSAVRKLTFPYVPGLLSFREAPAVIAAIRKLVNEPDVFLFDAQGLAHPRGLGLASHVGLILNRPSVGCAKSRLCGTHAAPRETRRSRATLSLDGQTIGAVVRTRKGVKPVYVSVGHRITLDDAVRCVLLCSGRYRLPEPTRLAHHLVTRLRLEIDP